MKFPSSPFRAYLLNVAIYFQSILAWIFFIMTVAFIVYTLRDKEPQSEILKDTFTFFLFLSMGLGYQEKLKQCVSSPLGHFLPRQRQIVIGSALFLGLAFSLLIAVPWFLGMGPVLTASIPKGILVFCTGLFMWSSSFLVSYKNTSFRNSIPYLLLFFGILYFPKEAYGVFVNYSLPLIVLFGGASASIWIYLFRSKANEKKPDDPFREIQWYPGASSDTYVREKAKPEIEEQNPSFIHEMLLRYLRRVGQFDLRRKIMFSFLTNPGRVAVKPRLWSLIIFTIISLILGYFGGAKGFLTFILIIPAITNRPSYGHGVILQGRVERCRQSILDIFLTVLLIGFFFVFIAAVTQLLQPHLPAVRIKGYRFLFHPVELSWALIPFVLFPLIQAILMLIAPMRILGLSLLGMFPIAAIMAYFLNITVVIRPGLAAFLAIPAWYFLAVMLERRFAKDDLVTNRENLMQRPI